jgi:50S ribosomal subunit-associated GTPase HflX
LHIKDASNIDNVSSKKIEQELQEKLTDSAKKIPIINVWNKVDLCQTAEKLKGISISAKFGNGISELKTESIK